MGPPPAPVYALPRPNPQTNLSTIVTAADGTVAALVQAREGTTGTQGENRFAYHRLVLLLVVGVDVFVQPR